MEVNSQILLKSTVVSCEGAPLHLTSGEGEGGPRGSLGAWGVMKFKVELPEEDRLLKEPQVSLLLA